MRIIDRFSSEHDVFLEQLDVIERLVRDDASAEGRCSLAEVRVGNVV